MNEAIEQIMVYLRGAWRYRWLIHAIAWPVCIGGWVFVYKMPDVYQSSVKVYVDTDSVLRPLLKGLAVGTDIDEQVRLMTRTLLSRTNLEKVLRMTDMDLSVPTAEEKESLIRTLQKTIVLKKGKEKLFTIKYHNSDPELAKKVVESLLTIFIENSLSGSSRDTVSAQGFLNKQIEEYELRLTEAENRIKEFKRKNIGKMPSEGRDYYQRLQLAMINLEQAQLKLKEETFRRDELRRQQLGEEPSFGIVRMPTVSEGHFVSSEDERIKVLQSKLDDLLLHFTDNHPDVSSLKRKLGELNKIRDKEREEFVQKESQIAKNQSAMKLNTNPVYQRMKISLAAAEASVAAFEVRVREYEARVGKLKAMVNTIPEVEADLMKLNRDYAINKQNYETLIARRESSIISEKAETGAETVNFKVIDPATLPLTPIAPNRMLLGTAVLFAGIALGIGFALFASEIKPTLQNRKSVIDTLGAAYLGSVSIVRNSKQLMSRRIEVISFSVVFIGLLIVYSGYMGMLLYAPNFLKVYL